MRRLVVAAFAGALFLAGCGGNDDEPSQATVGPDTTTAGQADAATSVLGGADATAGVDPTAAAGEVAETVDAAAVLVGEPFDAATDQVLSDGICMAAIPATWGISGAGSATTVSGASLRLFGGVLGSDEAWTSARERFVARQAGSGAEIGSVGDTVVLAELGEGRGYAVRVRLEGRYCDVTMQAREELGDADRAAFGRVVAGLKPAE